MSNLRRMNFYIIFDVSNKYVPQFCVNRPYIKHLMSYTCHHTPLFSGSFHFNVPSNTQDLLACEAMTKSGMTDDITAKKSTIKQHL